MGNYEVISKGTLINNGEPVYACHYLIVDEHRAVISFFNSSNVDVTGIRFVIRMLDAKGKLIEQKEVEDFGQSAMPKSEFKIAREVSENCTKIDVKIKSFISGDYEYIYDEGIRVRFCKDIDSRDQFTEEPTYTVALKSKKYTVLTYIFMIFVIVAVLFVVLLSGVFDADAQGSLPKEEYKLERVVNHVEI